MAMSLLSFASMPRLAQHRSRTLLRRYLPVVVGLAVIASTSAYMPVVGHNEDFPPTRVTAIADGTPGGGLDLTTRITKDGPEDADVDTFMSIENMGGGGGTPA